MNPSRYFPIIALMCAAYITNTTAQVPALISNQGRLFDGSKMLGGEVTMALRIYPSAVGGEYLYEDKNKVNVVDGYYFTYLGDHTTFGSLTDALADGEAYVEVVVNGVVFPPRELIPSVAFTFRADQADSVKPGGITSHMIAPRAVETEHIALGAVTATKLADDSVTMRSIEDGSISTLNLANDSVTFGKLSPELRERLARDDTPSTSVASNPSPSPYLRVEAQSTSPNLVGGHIANHAKPGTKGISIAGGGNASQPNVAQGGYSTVSGGLGNIALGRQSTVGGGRQNQATGPSSVVGGGYSNRTDSSYATVGGGFGNVATGYVSTVAGGWANSAHAEVSAVGGGQDNRVDGPASTVAGGWANHAAGFASAIAGGQLNTATGSHGAIGGGTNNTVEGTSAVVPGGANNTASGQGSFAAGTRAGALHEGAFVWSDRSSLPFASTGKGQFLIRAGGNVGIDTTTPVEKLTVNGNIAPELPGKSSLGTDALPWKSIHLSESINTVADLAIVQQGQTNVSVARDGTISIPGSVIAGRFMGDGSGLTGVTSGAMSPGSIADREISPTAALDPKKIAGTALTQTTTFDGDAAGTFDRLALRNGAVKTDVIANGAVTTEKLIDGSVTHRKLSRDVLDSLRASATFWRVGGNELGSGTDHFFGTTDEHPVEIRVNGQHALRLESEHGTPNIIGGYGDNSTAGGVSGAVVSGGGGTAGVNRVTGSFGTIGGGLSNTAGNEYATVGGGINNTAAGSAATVAGGWHNAANDLDATVGGGQDNIAAGSAATISGGFKNEALGDYATVPGGAGNKAQGAYSMAGGHGARALQDGSFVWADATGGNFESTAPHQFLIRASGNVGIDVNRPEEKLTVQGNIAPGKSASFALGTPNTRWHSLYLSSHVDFQDDLEFVSGRESRLTVDRDGNLTAGGRVIAASFVGDGSGLAGIDGNGITAGSIYDAQISQAANIDPRKVAGIALTESTRYAGDLTGGFKTLALKDRIVDTAKLADGAISASKLQQGAVGIEHLDETTRAALDSAQGSWNRTGNSGIRDGYDFLGTTDREPIEFRVHGKRALRLEPTKGSPNVLAGDERNSVKSGTIGAIIAGGGSISNPNHVDQNYGTVSGGIGNRSLNEYATISGGFGNLANGFDTTISGGQDNRAAGSGSSIGGGFTNVTTGSFSTIAGGANNRASGNVSSVTGGFGNEANGSYSTVMGGSQNTAVGDYSLAGGRRARAGHAGTYVWADSQDKEFASTDRGQFLIRASGGVGINMNRPAHPVHIAGGAYCTGSVWVNASDRNLKENFMPIDDKQLLARLESLPILAWNYKNEDNEIRHVGPTAQDFHKAFSLGNDNATISTVDSSGIALAAAKALHRDNRELRDENKELRGRLQAIERQLRALSARIPGE